VSGGGGVKGGGREEMTQTLYAHMNIIKKKKHTHTMEKRQLFDNGLEKLDILM
jgi:hypothetical protein